MFSVTGRVKLLEQEHEKRDYIKLRQFDKKIINDGIELRDSENISPAIVGMAVDYLSRMILEIYEANLISIPSVDDILYAKNPALNLLKISYNQKLFSQKFSEIKKNAFDISLRGARELDSMNGCADDETIYSLKILDSITGLDNNSIKYACQLVGYDSCFRSGLAAYVPVMTIQPDNNTIDNIRIMVKRVVAFFIVNGPIIIFGPTFEGGYSEIVSTGDGDYVTDDTIWDLKVSKKSPQTKHTLQLLMYYIMGKKSIHKEYNSVRYIGIYNPRLNISYKLDIAHLDKNIIEDVSKNVICYGKSFSEFLKNH